MSMDNLTGQVLSQYELREMLGAGGMGAVYRAYQANLKREVAVKVLPTQLAMQAGYVERFNREAETAAALEHAHIVPIYDYGVQNGTAFIVMRMLTGGSLAQRLALRADENRSLPSLGEIADLLNQIAGALDYAHSQGVIHRDIKPGNIVFDNQGSAYLADFGIAKLVDATHALTETGRSVGTPTYMAPEQWLTDTVVPATDQYALGIMTYMMIAGRVPFEASSAYALMNKHVNEQPPPLTALQPNAPEALDLVLGRALAKKPEDRFPTVAAFAQSFTRAIEGNTGEVTNLFRVPMPKRPAPPRPATIPATPTPSTINLADNQGVPAAVTAPLATAPAVTTPALRAASRRSPWIGLAALLAVIAIGAVVVGVTRPPALMALLSPANSSPTFVPSVPASATSVQIVLVITPTPVPVTPTNALAVAAVASQNTLTPTTTVTSSDTSQPSTSVIALLPTQIIADTSTIAPTFTTAPTNTERPTQTNTLPPTFTPTVQPTTALPSVTPSTIPSSTPIPTTAPTNTATITPSPIPTHTAVPTNTTIPSATSVPTNTAIPPTLVPTKTTTNTAVPNTPVPTASATISSTPVVIAVIPTLVPATAAPTVAPTDVVPANAVTTNGQWTPQVKQFNNVPMVLVPAGCFMMGSTDAQVAPGGDKFTDETPQTKVCFQTPFYIDKTPVSQAQFTQLQGRMLSLVSFPGKQLPVDSISWNEALKFCTNNRHMRLPTEAEWEYAARGPDDLIYPWGNKFDPSKVVFADNSQNQTAAVNRTDRIAASWVGATDMNGNISQWTSSIYQPYPYATSDGRESLTDTTSQRAFRGGSWDLDSATIHAAVRAGGDPNDKANNVGFRCAQNAR